MRCARNVRFTFLRNCSWCCCCGIQFHLPNPKQSVLSTLPTSLICWILPTSICVIYNCVKLWIFCPHNQSWQHCQQWMWVNNDGFVFVFFPLKIIGVASPLVDHTGELTWQDHYQKLQSLSLKPPGRKWVYAARRTVVVPSKKCQQSSKRGPYHTCASWPQKKFLNVGFFCWKLFQNQGHVYLLGEIHKGKEFSRLIEIYFRIVMNVHSEHIYNSV